MNSKFYFSRCRTCHQRALLVRIEERGVCKDCNPEAFEAQAQAEKDAWLSGETKPTS